MDLAPLLRQSVTWQVRTGENEGGDAIYVDATTVRGRAVSKLRDVIGPAGAIVTVAILVTTLVEPAPGDLLNGREVVTVGAVVDTAGATVGYQSTTR